MGSGTSAPIPNNNSGVYRESGTSSVYAGSSSQGSQVPSQNSTYQSGAVPNAGSYQGSPSYQSGSGSYQGNTNSQGSTVAQGSSVPQSRTVYQDGTVVYQGSPSTYQGSSTTSGSLSSTTTTGSTTTGSVAPSIVESIPGRSPVAGSVITSTDPRIGTNVGVSGSSQSIPSVNSSVGTQVGTTVERTINNGVGTINNGRLNGVPVEERVIGSGGTSFDSTVSNSPNSAVSSPSSTGLGTSSGSFSTSNNGVVSVPSGSVSAPSTNVATAPIQARFSEEDYYQQGFDLLKEAEHDQAVQIFQQQIVSYPQGELVDDAYYWIAESKYVNRDLTGSKQNFKKIIEGYKQSPRLPDAMLKTAYIEQEQGNEIEARILLQEIVQFHPQSNAAISARNRLAELN